MYIYDLPYEIRRELCRLLDDDNVWKELADNMSYKAFEIKEIEQMAHRNAKSSTDQLFTNWGQLNHRVGELFILLYRMKHIPALRVLLPVVESKYHVLLTKICPTGGREKDTSVIEDNHNKKQKVHTEDSLIPIPVKLIEQGVPLPTSSGGLVDSPTDDDFDISKVLAQPIFIRPQQKEILNSEICEIASCQFYCHPRRHPATRPESTSFMEVRIYGPTFMKAFLKLTHRPPVSS
ncbi:uncharacterized protein LOC114351582 [Ostrinia furnacalis]|uniref:uncharacterized protein LOC114351582 n=1 Tax=Ostrinia furnacalis TaxID=93504 RepID=UPI00103FBF98|nr:uncharacterized protein LOC114351582 [Ostrinia furnacalis]